LRRILFSLISCLALATPGRAQESAASATPAAVLLNLRGLLGLDSAQTRKLRELERTQSAALVRTTAAFLRAEADVVESTRQADANVRRTALERRARLAIDAEVARMGWEKDARAILTSSQDASLGRGLSTLTDAQPALWQSLTHPLPLASARTPRPDSGEVRVSVTPNFADIYVNGEKRATGRKFLVLPVGKYELKFHALGCKEIVIPVEISKGPPVVISRTLNCSK
jgi:hypothetical protein